MVGCVDGRIRLVELPSLASDALESVRKDLESVRKDDVVHLDDVCLDCDRQRVRSMIWSEQVTDIPFSKLL
jgi:hypothetical protein